MRALAAAFFLAWAGTVYANPDLERENRRLRDEVAALRAGDPDAVRKKAVAEYLAHAHPEQMPRFAARTEFHDGFVLADARGNHRLRINGILQFGFSRVQDVADGQKNIRNSWFLKTARLRLSGHAFTPRLRFFMDFDFQSGTARFDTHADLQVSEAWMSYQRPSWRKLRFRGGRLRPRFTGAEMVLDEQLSLVGRGLVAEYFTVGRSTGFAAWLENFGSGRTTVELTMSNGSESVNPDSQLGFDERRFALSLRVSHVLCGDGYARDLLAYEGDPYDQPDATLVLGFGAHIEDTEVDADVAKWRQYTLDVTYRRAGNYIALHAFYREGLRINDVLPSDDYGVQVTLSRFLIPRRLEATLRGGLLRYGPAAGAEGDLVEATFGLTYYWHNEDDWFQGHRMRVTVDIGYARNVVLGGDGTRYPSGHLRGIAFRSMFTIRF